MWGLQTTHLVEDNTLLGIPFETILFGWKSLAMHLVFDITGMGCSQSLITSIVKANSSSLPSIGSLQILAGPSLHVPIFCFNQVETFC